MRSRGSRAALLTAFLGVGSVAAAGCFPQAPRYVPPAPTTCDVQNQATPTPNQPVKFDAAVRKPGWATPVATTFTATSEADKNAKVAQLQQEGTVVAVAPDRTVRAQAGPDPAINTVPPNYPFFSQQWGLQAPPSGDFGPAWNAGYSGGGETIAVIDTGVDLNHQGLAGRIIAGPDFVTDPSGATPVSAALPGHGDPDGHGTHVAGIAADADTSGGLGGAPNAHVLAVRVLDASGSGSESNVYNGIVWATTHGANVINLSLGADGCDNGFLQTALQTAVSARVVVVAAAGNSASAGLFSPAGYTNEVVAVAATDSLGNRASFSNYGSYVSIAGPGLNVLSTCAWTGGSCIAPEGGSVQSDVAYGYLSGTSMATPFVSAAAALIKEECPGISASGVKAELVNHAGSAVPGFAFHHLDAGSAVAANCT